MKTAAPSPPVQLILPMAGESRRFFDAGYTEPKPFFKIGNRKMIGRVVEQFPTSWRRIFVLNEKMCDYQKEALGYLSDPADLVFVEPNKDGPLRSTEKALEVVDLDAAVFLSYCDYQMHWDSENFKNFVAEKNCDIAVITYRGFHPHYCIEDSPKHSYCYVRTLGDVEKLATESERVIQLQEKRPFTDCREKEHASTGGYYFRSGALLKEGVRIQRERNLHWRGEYFTSFAIQALMEADTQLKVLVYEVPYFFQWGTPEDVRAFEYWETRLNLSGAAQVSPTDEESLKVLAPQYAKKIPAQLKYFKKAFRAQGYLSNQDV